MVLSGGKILKEARNMADGMRKSSHPPALRHTVLLRGCVGQRSVKRGVTAGRRAAAPRGDGFPRLRPARAAAIPREKDKDTPVRNRPNAPAPPR